MKVFQTFAAAGAITIITSVAAHAGALPASGEVQLDNAVSPPAGAASAGLSLHYLN